MDDRCESTRDRLAGDGGPSVARPAAVREHLAACEACAEYARVLERVLPRLAVLSRVPAPPELEGRVQIELSADGRMLRLTRRLRELRRAPAPAELDGRVVAELHAGRRQDRAIEHVRALSRQPVPAELDEAVARRLEEQAAEAGLRAPRELERRVAADMRARFRRRVARLAEVLSHGAPGERLPHGTRNHRLGLALAVLVTALLFGWALGPGERTGARAGGGSLVLSDLGVEFELELVSVAELGPLGSGLLGSISGGLSDGLSRSARSTSRLPAQRRQAVAPESLHEPAGREGPSGDGPGRSLEVELETSLLGRIAAAPFTTRYRGERRVTLTDPDNGQELVLLEEVSADGEGRFAIDPGEVVSAPDDSEAHGSSFRELQKGREGFFYRYRDFLVRDLEQFQERYVARELAQRPLIAGYACVLLDVRRTELAERFYRVAVEPASGLVLRYEELRVDDPDASPLVRVEFESLELGPAIELPALSGGPSAWVEFDPEDPPPGAIDFAVLRPDYVPPGFALERTATRTGPLGATWVESRYGDGVEEIFFLHSGEGLGDGSAGATLGGRVRISSLGSWSVLEGSVRGVPVAAVGRLDPFQLILLVQSAFD